MLQPAFEGDDTRPYDVRAVEGRPVVVLLFASICNFVRMPAHEQETADLLATNEALIADLSKTVVLGTPWLRWLGTLGGRAKHAGQRVFIAGARPQIRTTADALALGDAVEWVDHVDAGLRACE